MSIKILPKSELSSKIAVIVGTRPGIIKFSPVIRALNEISAPFFIIHTGQHFSYNMDRQFFEDLDLPKPRYANEKTQKEILHGAQTAEMIRGVEEALLRSKPRVVIVGGDANTNLAGALAARKLGLVLCHMEAGLRSGDWRMPEEHNRVMIDHISDVLLAPTEGAKRNLIDDNVKGEIHVVGNPIVDAVYQNLMFAKSKSKILRKLDIAKGKYFLLTIHREETVDNAVTLEMIVNNVEWFLQEYPFPLVFPLHPRTRNSLEMYGLMEKLQHFRDIKIIDAVGYLDFLLLLSSAKIVLTDSGGIQEEACILRVPCVTLRENTERPETIEVGANIIVGAERQLSMEAIDHFLAIEKTSWENPFGDGKAGVRIAEICMEKISTN